MSAGLFEKTEMLNMLKHLGDEFAGAKITQNKKKEIEALALAKKEIQLEKGDLKNLMDDIYGIKDKECEK